MLTLLAIAFGSPLLCSVLSTGRPLPCVGPSPMLEATPVTTQSQLLAGRQRHPARKADVRLGLGLWRALLPRSLIPDQRRGVRTCFWMALTGHQTCRPGVACVESCNLDLAGLGERERERERDV